jgi:HlyD family secretion protein
VRRVVSTSGPVRALVTVSVGSQLSGQIKELKVDFNSEVREGDVMAVIDDATFQQRVNQGTADLAMSRATVEVQEAVVLKAQAQVDQAERAMARVRALSAKGVASQAALDTAQRDLDVAKAELATARASLSNAKAGVTQKEAALGQSRIDLDRTRIVSPIKGTVISRTIDIGQTVAASLQAPELFKIAQDLSRIRIEAQVNEADVGAIREGNTATFTVDAYPERKFTGKVTQVRLAATELNNVVTYTVIIEAVNDDRKLFPGMTANAQIETAVRQNVLRIANDATRFKPKNAAAEQDSLRATPEERLARMQALVAELKEGVGLSNDQAGRLNEMFATAINRSRGAGTAGPGAGAEGALRDPAEIRARIRERIDRAVTSVLKPEQKEAYAAWKAERETTREATVYVLEGNEPKPRRVRLGITDDQYAQVVGGDLKTGDDVIVRARKQTK